MRACGSNITQRSSNEHTAGRTDALCQLTEEGVQRVGGALFTHANLSLTAIHRISHQRPRYALVDAIIQGMGYTAIADKLNDMHIPARKSGEWNFGSTANILNNEVYPGKIRWRQEPVKRVIKDGMTAKKRIQNDDYELYEGRHDAILTQEHWDLVKTAQKKRGHHSTHITKELQDPFVGILYCDKCGAKLKRNVPGKDHGTTPWFRCPTRHCDRRATKCHIVEEAIRNPVDDWLEEYIIQLSREEKPSIDPVAEALDTVQAQLAALQHQQENICEYLEKGVYTIDMFTKRNASLSKEIKQLQTAEADLLRQQDEGDRKKQSTVQIIPTTQHILESYPILSPAEKNRLWKLVMKKATVYRSQEDNLTVNIYPNLPKLDWQR